MLESNKGACAIEGSFEKKGGDINKVTLFRGACWQEVDRCRGLFFRGFDRIKCIFVCDVARIAVFLYLSNICTDYLIFDIE